MQRFNAFEFDAEDEEAKRESYYDSLQEKIAEEFKDYDFNKLIHNRMELEQFRQFLGKDRKEMSNSQIPGSKGSSVT